MRKILLLLGSLLVAVTFILSVSGLDRKSTQVTSWKGVPKSGLRQWVSKKKILKQIPQVQKEEKTLPDQLLSSPSAPILVVDDDLSITAGYPDVRSEYTSSLDLAGYSVQYDIWEVAGGMANGPDSATMGPYQAVIWFTGQSLGFLPDVTLSPTDQDELRKYLSGGGTLFLVSQDFFWDQYPAAGAFFPGEFPYDVLGCASTIQDVSGGSDFTAFGATGSVGDGMTMNVSGSTPIFEWYDQVTSLPSATESFNDGIGAIALQDTACKVVFFAFPFENIMDGVSPNTKADLIPSVMTCLGVTPMPPANDVKTLTIDNPGLVVYLGDILNPAATVINLGTNAATFDVICNIDSIGPLILVYSDTVNIAGLASFADTSVTFTKLWTSAATPGITYQVTVYTTLLGDENPSNDTLIATTITFDTSWTILSPFTTSPPTIDGTLFPGEWADALMRDVSDVLGNDAFTNPPGSVILYMKNDSNNVYFGIDAIADVTIDLADVFNPIFDDNHDDTYPLWPDSSEGEIWIQEYVPEDTVWFNPVTSDLGALGFRDTGFPGVAALSSGRMQYEIALPLGSLPGELSAFPGDTVGMWFFVGDASIFDMIGWWPTTAPNAWNFPMGDLVLGTTPVGIEEVSVSTPRIFTLFQNKPNPFFHQTEIHYQIPVKGEVSLKVYDPAGRLVRTLVDESQEPGVYQVVWNGKNQASGIYFYRLKSGDYTATRKLILLR